tara:strand:+ start:355 stop:888 length:534 start_codon:yes stop_codon:yes gene_type:complete
VKTLIFDTETTALVPNSLIDEKHQPHVTEFYGHVINEKGKQLHELTFLCNPGVKIPDKVVRITGITDELLKDEPSFAAFDDMVVALIDQADEVVAHNLSYDMFVIDTELKRLGKAARWPLKRLCTVEETEWFKGFRLNLGTLHEHLFGEPFKGAHRAKGDVDALTKCFLELRERGDL